MKANWCRRNAENKKHATRNSKESFRVQSRQSSYTSYVLVCV